MQSRRRASKKRDLWQKFAVKTFQRFSQSRKVHKGHFRMKASNKSLVKKIRVPSVSAGADLTKLGGPNFSEKIHM
jgi:hypothetical protein